MATPKKTIPKKTKRPAKKKTGVKPPATVPASLRWFYHLAGRPLFRRIYPIVALLVLATTTTLWAYWGARLQATNADQLADPYLFSNTTTLQNATFPGTHTFLLKWPIFWLLHFFHSSPHSLVVATVATAFVTVAALVVVLHRIERRPLVFGTICFAISLLLLLVPAQPYAGGLLPVNMAMLATRNLEYVVYLAALLFIVRAHRFQSRQFVGGTLLLVVLIASDKLFLSLSAGGALLTLVVYAVVRNWDLVNVATRWLVASIAAAVGSAGLVAVLKLTGVAHFANESGANPYALVSGAKTFITGVIYAVLGLLTNFGANPAYDATELRHIPHQLLTHLVSPAGPAYVLSLAVTLYAFYLLWCLVRPSFRRGQRPSQKSQHAVHLSIMLIWTSVAALGVFVATTHYYAVDARYLTIAFFAVCVAATTVLRSRKLRPEFLVIVGCLLCLGIVAATFSARATHRQQIGALADIDHRNGLVAQALSHHHASVLVGDYWRVLPIRQASAGKLNVLPLGDCTQPRQVLSSTAWQPDLTKHSFAYLYSLDSSLTDYPHCNVAQIVAFYGRPNASLVVSGTIAQPKEILLFYDHGAHKPTPSLDVPAKNSIATVLPITPEEVMGANCIVPTDLTVVAHQDDDILFTSPDLLHNIEAGHCIRTLFLTAGDSGSNRFYWINRQQGAEAAYNSMLGTPHEVWVERIVRLTGGQYVTVASPRANAKISLVFFNLPDGNLHGEGFGVSHHESLQKLYDGSITDLQTVDGQSSYTASELMNGLQELMQIYHPAEVITQAAQPAETPFPDHSDHVATGNFTVKAVQQYDQALFSGNIATPVKRYMGYPIHGYDPNVSGDDLQKKEAAFLAYAKFDGGVCHTVDDCSRTSTYGSYLIRQYQQDQ